MMDGVYGCNIRMLILLNLAFAIFPSGNKFSVGTMYFTPERDASKIFQRFFISNTLAKSQTV